MRKFPAALAAITATAFLGSAATASATPVSPYSRVVHFASGSATPTWNQVPHSTSTQQVDATHVATDVVLTITNPFATSKVSNRLQIKPNRHFNVWVTIGVLGHEDRSLTTVGKAPVRICVTPVASGQRHCRLYATSPTGQIKLYLVADRTLVIQAFQPSFDGGYYVNQTSAKVVVAVKR